MESKNKGQSALEYLMTYGWALIVIVVVIAVLVGMQPKAGFTCNGFGGKMQIQSSELSSQGVTLAVVNGTGRPLTGISFGGKYTQGNSTYAIAATTPTSGATTAVAGTVQQTTPLAPVDVNLATGNVVVDLNITYNDGYLDKVEAANCSGQLSS